jgi:hypothetical protein
MVPPAKRLIFRKAYNSIYLFLSHYDKKEEALEYNFENKNFFGVAKELIANTFEISLDAVLLLLKMDLVPIAGHILGGFNVQGYCHIGGLYVLKDNTIVKVKQNKNNNNNIAKIDDKNKLFKNKNNSLIENLQSKSNHSINNNDNNNNNNN